MIRWERENEDSISCCFSSAGSAIFSKNYVAVIAGKEEFSKRLENKSNENVLRTRC